MADTESIGLKLKVLGALAHAPGFQDVCRMLYYLTGMSTERSAVLAYNLLHDGMVDAGLTVSREVLREQPARYRIEGDDGHESIYTPAAGALHPERGRAGAFG